MSKPSFLGLLNLWPLVTGLIFTDPVRFG